MKELYKSDVGGDGGKVLLSAEEGMLNLAFSFPISKIVAPIEAKLITLLPDWADKYAHNLSDLILKAVGMEALVREEVAAAEVIAEPAQPGIA